jgi:hypothetical protein
LKKYTNAIPKQNLLNQGTQWFLDQEQQQRAAAAFEHPAKNPHRLTRVDSAHHHLPQGSIPFGMDNPCTLPTENGTPWSESAKNIKTTDATSATSTDISNTIVQSINA